MFRLADLDDLILLGVFKKCSLNERTNLRLVNKKFRYLVDQLSFNDLIVFDRMPPVISTYKFTNDERWRTEDTVYVTNLNKFVRRFADKLENVKRLVIRSVNKFEYDFNVDLKRLTHLEL